MNKIKLPINIRIKELRKEKNLTQEELAKKMQLDSKMISFYENSKSTPSVEALIKIARIFDISVDYLLFEEAPRRPLKQIANKELIEQLSDLDKLTEEDKNSIKHIIKSFVAKNQVKELISKVN